MIIRILVILVTVSLANTVRTSNTTSFAWQVDIASLERSTEPDDAARDEMQPRWWKGNLHTHSFWSDGNDFPEMIADWYRTEGYHFLAISDHNVLQEGMRWIRVSEIMRRAPPEAVDRYRNRFGKLWVETRGGSHEDPEEIRLKPLHEYRHLLERAEEFLLITSEEVSDQVAGKPVHINAANIRQTIQPLGGATVREAIENNLRAILEQEKLFGIEVLPHLNHPNFGYAVTYEDLASVMSEKFFEVYNGHPSVNHLGDEQHPSVERMWDLANHLRVNKLGGDPIFGIAVDDSHEYFGRPGSRPGRGWVMVRAVYLTPESLIRALKAGDFYASSGVLLDDISWSTETNTLTIRIAPQDHATYRTDFIVIAKDADGEGIGKVAFSSEEMTCSYPLAEGETIVRAVITSSLPVRDPVFDGQKQQAWTQPWLRTEAKTSSSE